MVFSEFHSHTANRPRLNGPEAGCACNDHEGECPGRASRRTHDAAGHGAAFRRRGVDSARRQVARRPEDEARHRGPADGPLQGIGPLSDRRARGTRRPGSRRARPLDRVVGARPHGCVAYAGRAHPRPGNPRAALRPHRRDARALSDCRPRAASARAASRRPSPTPAPIRARCARPPCSTATTTSSTA